MNDSLRGILANTLIRRKTRVDYLCATLAASQVPRNRGDRVPRIGQEDDQTIAEDIRRGCRQSNAVQFVPLVVGQLDAASHGNLPAAPPPGVKSDDRYGKGKSFCVST